MASIDYEGDGAILSEDREYRYRLWRTLPQEGPIVAFIMLNPSTADETTMDQTARRCRGFAESWGYGTVVLGNLFALRSTDPGELYDHPDPVGPDNDDHLRAIAADAETVVAAWGVKGSYQDRGATVSELLDEQLYALDLTKEGHPAHPLFQPGDTEPQLFDPECGEVDASWN